MARPTPQMPEDVLSDDDFHAMEEILRQGRVAEDRANLRRLCRRGLLHRHGLSDAKPSAYALSAWGEIAWRQEHRRRARARRG